MLLGQGTLVILAYVTSCVTADLVLVHVVFRHGERTPADTYPNDPYINDPLEPVGWGQLTNQGKRDQFNQGRFLRDRYNSFLGELYSGTVIKVQSTDVDRTKMSAQLEMAGLWPPAEEQRWRHCLNWQPVPISAQPLNQDDLLLVRIPCLRYHEELDRVMNSAVVQGELDALNADQLYAELTTITGMNIGSPDDVQSLYSTLKAEKAFGLTLPPWTHGYYPDRLEPLTAYSFQLNSYNTQLQKLRGGPLLKKIVNETVEAASGTLKPAGRKMFVYAGHDSTVANLLMALDVWDGQIPDYGIMTLIELHYDDNEYHVRVFLRNTTTHAPYRLSLPGCTHRCPLGDFVSLTADVLPGTLTQECVPIDPNYTHSGSSGP